MKNEKADSLENSNLIAAAPDLLAACRGALDFMVNLKVELRQYMPFREVQALESAIAKAEK